MKKRGKAQIAMEYILIVALVLVILLPGIYVFKSYAQDSNDNIVASRLSDMSDEIFAKAKNIYYYGPPSKSSIILDIPPQIMNMYVLSIPDNKEYYLVFDLSSPRGPQPIIFEASIPIAPGEMTLCPLILGQDCTGATCECFPEKFFLSGKKEFILKAENNCAGATQCILINMS